MAKYQKAINIWPITDKILSGEIVLQSGQWIYCGNDGIKSRYIGTNGRSIDACHGGDTKQVTARYKERVKHHRMAQERRNRINDTIASLDLKSPTAASEGRSSLPSVSDKLRENKRKYFDKTAK